jgi:hypothetical protein
MKGTQHDTVVGMSEDRWAQVDEYIRDVVAAEDAGLRGALDATVVGHGRFGRSVLVAASVDRGSDRLCPG